MIRAILLQSEGWLVGGAVKNTLEGKEVNDYDIIVPSRELYQITCSTLHPHFEHVQFNSFGGLFLKIDGLQIDLWPEELDHFIKTANKFEYAYNMKRNILIKNEN